MARAALAAELLEEEEMLSQYKTGREALLADLRSMMQQQMTTDIFALLAAVLQKRAGKVQAKSDATWDEMMRMKDLTIFVYSMLGLATSIATATAFWYFGKRSHTTLSQVRQDQLWVLIFLQFVLTFSTAVTCVLIFQKYTWTMREKRKEWSGIDMYDIVQAKEKADEVKGRFKASYSFWRTSLRWKLFFEIGVHVLHPLIWMNTDKTKQMYEAFQIMIFLRTYLAVNMVYSFSEQYKQRHDIIASDVDLQRSGFQLSVGSTLKMLFYLNPATAAGALLIGALSLLGFIVFVVERSADEAVVPKDKNAFRELQSSLWFAFVTFATVGYGDMAPVTGFGRFASVAIGAIGITVTTIFGGVVTNLIRESREQRYVSEYLTLRRARDENKTAAARVIQMAYRWYKSRTRDIVTPWSAHGHKSNFVYGAIQNFRVTRWEMRQSQSASADPVTDSSMNGVRLHLRKSVELLRKHEKQLKTTESNIASYVNDICKLLERTTEAKRGEHLSPTR